MYTAEVHFPRLLRYTTCNLGGENPFFYIKNNYDKVMTIHRKPIKTITEQKQKC